jgi:hypothetical protein
MPTVAYRVIRSRRAFVNAPVARRVLEHALDAEVKPHFVTAFEEVVGNWKNKPKFEGRKFITADAIRVSVFPQGPNKEIYKYVTKGTRRHPIPKTPKVNGSLVFVWGGPGSYKPKTAPGGKWGGPGIATGKLTFRKQVQHPGNKPRDFEGFIRKREEPWFTKTMENAWKRAIRSMKT